MKYIEYDLSEEENDNFIEGEGMLDDVFELALDIIKSLGIPAHYMFQQQFLNRIGFENIVEECEIKSLEEL